MPPFWPGPLSARQPGALGLAQSHPPACEPCPLAVAQSHSSVIRDRHLPRSPRGTADLPDMAGRPRTSRRRLPLGLLPSAHGRPRSRSLERPPSGRTSLLPAPVPLRARDPRQSGGQAHPPWNLQGAGAPVRMVCHKRRSSGLEGRHPGLTSVFTPRLILMVRGPSDTSSPSTKSSGSRVGSLPSQAAGSTGHWTSLTAWGPSVNASVRQRGVLQLALPSRPLLSESVRLVDVLLPPLFCSVRKGLSNSTCVSRLKIVNREAPWRS
jgi:hypothetical protein